tara:strand:+ start:2118 stop:2243 length:126 start_codon:yes stop_codon:yes gene_type:complete
MKYIKQNPKKALEDIMFVLGASAMVAMLFFIGSIVLHNSIL